MNTKIKRGWKILPAFLLVFITSCSNNTDGPSSITEGNFNNTISTSVEWYVDRDSSLPDKNSVARVIAKGYNWSEGPFWFYRYLESSRAGWIQWISTGFKGKISHLPTRRQASLSHE